jgi:hypothetical protein
MPGAIDTQTLLLTRTVSTMASEPGLRKSRGMKCTSGAVSSILPERLRNID